MALERSWNVVPPQAFTADGTAQGIITLANTAGFKTKQIAYLSSSTLPTPINVKIMKLLSPTMLIVGPPSANVTSWMPYDISAYTLAAGATIGAAEQGKTANPPDGDHYKAVYESDPTVADRVVFVDQYGNFYDKNNPMPIVFDGTVSIGQVEVVGSNGNILEPNADGSINVNILPSTGTTDTVKNVFGSAAAVISGATTTIVQYTVPLNKTSILERCEGSGENIGTYTVLVNNVAIALLRTYYAGGFNVEFDFTTGQDNGLILQPGDNVKVTILHNRPSPANFDARIQVFEITI